MNPDKFELTGDDDIIKDLNPEVPEGEANPSVDEEEFDEDDEFDDDDDDDEEDEDDE